MKRTDILRHLEAILDGSYATISMDDADSAIAAEGDDVSGKIVHALNELYRQKQKDRNQYRQELVKSEARLKKIIESTPLGICITNEEGIFEYVNPNYCRLYGYGSEELLGKHFTIVVPDDGKEELTRLHADFMGRTYELRGEWQVKRRDGMLLAILADAAYIIDVDGKPKKVTFVLDITERKRLEQTREDVERMIRHDLRNPLNGIIGAAELLLTDELSEEHREFAGMIRDAGWKLNHMLSAGTDIIRMEQGTYEFQPKSLNLVEIVKKVGKGIARPGQEDNIAIEYMYDGNRLNTGEEIPDCPISGEAGYLENLFSNLLFNAVEASDPGDKVTVNFITGTRESGTYIVEIHNTRPVPESVRKQFFEKYVTQGKKNGTGLGTYIARLIARVHGGDITFTSSGENGTTVRVSLPKER